MFKYSCIFMFANIYMNYLKQNYRVSACYIISYMSK